MLWDVFPDGEHFGGAPANVAVHAAGLGADALMISAVGTDARGDEALQRLAACGVNCSAVARLADHATGVVHVRIDAAGLPSYDIARGSAWDFIPWTAPVERAAQRADAICFGTLAQASAESRATIRRAVAATRAAAWRLFDVNLRQTYYDAGLVVASLDLANAVKLNEEELPVVARLCGLESVTPVEQLRELCGRFGLRLAALTALRVYGRLPRRGPRSWIRWAPATPSAPRYSWGFLPASRSMKSTGARTRWRRTCAQRRERRR